MHDNKFICLQIRKFMSSTFAILLIFNLHTKSLEGKWKTGITEGSKLKGNWVIATEIDWALITRLPGDFNNKRLFLAQK